VAVAGAEELRAGAAALMIRPDPAAAVELVRAGQATRIALILSGATGIAGTAAGLGLAAAGVIGPAGAALAALLTSAAAIASAASPLLGRSR
jgi:diacylglycerol kinase family enzyme